MGKLLKYEFRNSRKKVFQQIGIILLVSLILQVILSGVARYSLSNIAHTGPMGLIATVSGLFVFVGTVLIIVTGFMYYITLANILKKDVYYGQGYITFSIPKSGYQIIGSKILIALFWLIVLPIVTITVNVLLGYIIWVMIPGVIKVDQFWMRISEFLNSNAFYKGLQGISLNVILYFSISWLVNSIFTILLMYVSVIVDYRIGRRKRDSSMWILYYIIFVIIYTFIMVIVFSPLSITNQTTSINMYTGLATGNEFYLTKYLSLAINFVVSILLYIFVSHNFENKIEK